MQEQSPRTDADQAQSPVAVDIKVLARAERRTLEVLYLELREFAVVNGLKVDYKLTVSEPGDQTGA